MRIKSHGVQLSQHQRRARSIRKNNRQVIAFPLFILQGLSPFFIILVSRYRKTHLFDEPGFDTTVTPEIVTFVTDFGVRFGTFICFDILFSVPPLSLTRALGVSNIVYNTAWFSEVPFLTGTSTYTISKYFAVYVILFTRDELLSNFPLQPFKRNLDGPTPRT